MRDQLPESVFKLSSSLPANIEKAWWEVQLTPRAHNASWLFPNETKEIEVSAFGQTAVSQVRQIAKRYHCELTQVM